MIDAVALPEAALLMIDDPELRTLFQGINAAAATPLIRDAFQIVYEDLAPVRFAGDIIFKQLSKSAQSASADCATLAEALPAAQLETMRRLFDLVDADSSGELDRDELLESGMLSALNLVGEGSTEEEAVDEFMAASDADNNGALSFVEFASAAVKEPKLKTADASGLETMRRVFDLIDADHSGELDRDELLESGLLASLQMVGEGSTEEEAVDKFMAATDADDNGQVSFVEFAAAAAKEPKLRDADAVLLELMEYYSLESAKSLDKEGAAPRKGRRQRKDPVEKFDMMLATFREWQDKPKLVASVDVTTRLGQVLMGCFAGTGNASLVAALRLVYVKYAPLRVGGDMIFKLVQRVVRDFI